MYTSDASRKESSRLGCGIPILIGGAAFVLFGCFWHIPHVTRTTGVIVESTPAIYGQTRRTITYEYVAFGHRHRGQRFLRTASQYVGLFDVGASFPVYFEDDHPEDSYAPYPPRLWPIIIVGIIWLALGGLFIIVARPYTNT